MNKMAKKIIIYSMVGLFQLGLGVSAIEAAPAPEVYPWQQQQDNDKQQQKQGNDRQHQQQDSDKQRQEQGDNKHQQEPGNDKPWQEQDRDK